MQRERALNGNEVQICPACQTSQTSVKERGFGYKCCDYCARELGID